MESNTPKRREFIIISILNFIGVFFYGLCPVFDFIMYKLFPNPAFDVDDTILYVIIIVLGVPPSVLMFLAALYSLKKRKWGLVLTASIVAFIPGLFVLMFFINDLLNYFSGYSNFPHSLLFAIPFIISVTNLILVIKSKRYFVNNKAKRNQTVVRMAGQ
jgi:hypothetical protein